MESIKFGSLDEFLSISGESDQRFEYTVAWLDCVSRGASFGRGIFMRGNHSNRPAPKRLRGKRTLTVPCEFPGFALNRWSVAAFNAFWYHVKQIRRSVTTTVHYDPFFYPLDMINDWNKIYGVRGLVQFQCVVPKNDGAAVVKDILQQVVEQGSASFLNVIKEFGEIRSPGMLSFPRPGVTLCMDFPFRGERTLDLFRRLEELVRAAGGAMYPAKDATMSGASFRQFYPQWKEFAGHCDSRFSSSFWRRVTEEGEA